MKIRFYCWTVLCLALLMPGLLHAQYQVAITDASSLVRVGMNPHPTDSADIAVAYTLLNAIDGEDADSMAYVRDYYQRKAANADVQEKSYGSLAYIISRMMAAHDGEAVDEADYLTDNLFHFFADNRCEHLVNYLVLKYELNGFRPRSIREYLDQRNFYDDLLMFNAPDRASWDMTSEILSRMPVSPGEKMVDVGCGFGYYSFRFANLVGPEGMVYATDTEESYTDYLSEMVADSRRENIRVIHSTSTDLSVDDQVDCIFMSSLYHVFYTWSREDERRPFLTSVCEHLKPGGRIVIIDNVNLHGEEMNNCHVSPELIQAQLGYWGFEPVSYDLLSDKRFMLVLRRNEGYEPHHLLQEPSDKPVLTINGQKSVIHIGSLDSYDITDRGIDAASYVYDFLSSGDRTLADIAIKKYDDLIPAENFGGEFSALQWVCEVMTADEEKQSILLEDPLSRSFYHKMTDDSCQVLKYYLLHKYKLGNDSLRMLTDSLLEMSGEVGRTHRSYLEDYILALNPKRPLWENTPVIEANVGIQPGDVVADIGCGSGFFTYRFSKMVGEGGKVYALEIKDEHIESLQQFLDVEQIRNVQVIKGAEDIIELPQPVDKMFMCSLYHVLYGVISDRDRHAYLTSLCQCLKPDGELIIVDNGPVDDDTLPYHGPYISKELIEYQLSFYGFQLIESIQIIPQRYMLKFKFTPQRASASWKE